jgi:hypothetical protein
MTGDPFQPGLGQSGSDAMGDAGAHPGADEPHTPSSFMSVFGPRSDSPAPQDGDGLSEAQPSAVAAPPMGHGTPPDAHINRAAHRDVRAPRHRYGGATHHGRGAHLRRP